MVGISHLTNMSRSSQSFLKLRCMGLGKKVAPTLSRRNLLSASRRRAGIRFDRRWPQPFGMTVGSLYSETCSLHKISAWIMCGFQSTTFGNNKLALEYFTRAEEVLKWGNNLWEKVSTKDRGVVFEKTFIRAVSRMRLNAMHKVSRVSYTATNPFIRMVLLSVSCTGPKGLPCHL